MPIIIGCPSCGGKLRVTDALFGQKVRCPACHHTFDGPVEPEPPKAAPRLPQDLPLDLSLDEPSSPPPSPPEGGLLGAVELKSSEENPSSAADTRRRPRPADKRLHLDQPNLRRLGPRRDAEPDRGTVILVLGIISLACLMVCYPIGVILGLAAWIMGQIDLRKMKNGQMDEKGRGTTQAGWICGIIGTILNGLITLSCGLFIGGIWYSEVSRPPITRPAPPVRPRQLPPPPIKPVNPPPKNPPGR